MPDLDRVCIWWEVAGIVVGTGMVVGTGIWREVGGIVVGTESGMGVVFGMDIVVEIGSDIKVGIGKGGVGWVTDIGSGIEVGNEEVDGMGPKRDAEEWEQPVKYKKRT